MACWKIKCISEMTPSVQENATSWWYFLPNKAHKLSLDFCCLVQSANRKTKKENFSQTFSKLKSLLKAISEQKT